MGSYEFDRARAALPGLTDCTYLNVGTFGIMAQPVLDRFLEYVVQSEQLGSPGYFEVAKQVRTARKRLADFLGCQDAELAFTQNATHGLNLPAFGLPLGPETAVLLSREEYPITEHIFRYREQQGGPRVLFFDISHDPAETLEHVERAWRDEVRCVVVSSVTCETAVRLPVAEICALARQRGAWSVVDAAQSIGQYPLNLQEIGCDFALGGGHKWLCGPKGVGLFYARSNSIKDLAPPWISHYCSRDPETQVVTVPNDRRKVELLGRSYAVYAAMTPALDWLEGLGWENVWQHMAHMRELICQEIERRPKLHLVSPRQIEHSSSMVTFRMPGVDEKNVEDFVEQAWEKERLYIRASTIAAGIRLSAAYFTSEHDINRFFQYVDSLV